MKIQAIAIGILCLVLSNGRTWAQETDYNAGTHSSPLQEAGGTARSMGMGSAVIAVSDGSGSLLWNPAGLSRMPCKEVGFHSNTGLASTVQETAIFGMPLGPVEDGCQSGSYGGLAASLSYTNYGTFNGTSADGAATGSYGASGDVNGSVGYGKEIFPGFSAGVSLKADQSSYAGQNYNAFASDIGVLWTVIPRVNLGLVYSNINLGETVGGSQPAAGWRLGTSWNATDHWLLAMSGELQANGLDRLQMGTEYLIGDLEKKAGVLALRLGYVADYPDPQLTGFTGMTWGLGYAITKSMTVDYAMVPVGDLGTSQRVSLTFKFDCPKKTPPAAAPVVIKSVVLEDSHFDFDKSTLRPAGKDRLREYVAMLQANPKDSVRVSGYTSMSGTAEYNQKLSERRAAAVKAYLVDEGGIAASRITTIGYGETRPAAYEAVPADTGSAAAKSNMRALFELTVQ